MQNQIITAAENGADGVVLGVLNKEANFIDINALRYLMKVCMENNLKVTFHRAFDAIASSLEAIEVLIDNGVKRVLTSGTVWGQKGTAIDGIDHIKKIIDKASGKIEVVIGGGINADNAFTILDSFHNKYISLHAYSGAQEAGITTHVAVKTLVEEVNRLTNR